jgi:hypothetical protein
VIWSVFVFQRPLFLKQKMRITWVVAQRGSARGYACVRSTHCTLLSPRIGIDERIFPPKPLLRIFTGLRCNVPGFDLLSGERAIS